MLHPFSKMPLYKSTLGILQFSGEQITPVCCVITSASSELSSQPLQLFFPRGKFDTAGKQLFVFAFPFGEIYDFRELTECLTPARIRRLLEPNRLHLNGFSISSDFARKMKSSAESFIFIWRKIRGLQKFEDSEKTQIVDP